MWFCVIAAEEGRQIFTNPECSMPRVMCAGFCVVFGEERWIRTQIEDIYVL